MDKNKIVQALDIAQCELRAMSKRNGIINSTALRMVDDAYFEAKNCSIPIVMPSLSDIDFKNLRKSKGLTLKKVEEITGISNSYLSQLETGKIKAPSYDVVSKLFHLYNEA